MCLLLFTKLLPAFQEVPLNLLSEKESVDLLLSMGKVETITDSALAAAKKIAKAANYLRTCQTSKVCNFVINVFHYPALYLSILGGVVAQVSNRKVSLLGIHFAISVIISLSLMFCYVSTRVTRLGKTSCWKGVCLDSMNYLKYFERALGTGARSCWCDQRSRDGR